MTDLAIMFVDDEISNLQSLEMELEKALAILTDLAMMPTTWLNEFKQAATRVNVR